MNRRGRPPHPDVLTPREWEVPALLREGLSDQAIAGRMGISLDGAKYHVREILSKLGVSSRHEAAAWERQEPVPARRWLGLPLLAPFAGALVVLAAVAGLGVLAAGLVLDSEEAATAGDHSAEEAAALMLAGRELRGVITTASAERTTPSAALESLKREGVQLAGSPREDAEFWLVLFRGEFDVQVRQEGFRFLFPIGVPIGPRDGVERQCTRAAAKVYSDLYVSLIAGPELPADDCRSDGRASPEAAIAVAGQASYEVIGARALSDASAELTEGETVWQVTILNLPFEAETSTSLECRQMVVRMDASSLQILETTLPSEGDCVNSPIYSMTREDVQALAESKAYEEIYIGTLEQVEVERIRMADARTFYFAARAIHNFADDGPPTPSQSPAWRVAMRGALLLGGPLDIGACRDLTVYVDDATGEPIYMTYEVLEPDDCELPVPTYPPVEQQ